MKKEAIMNFVTSAVASVILTVLVVGLVVGDKLIPANVAQNVIGNIPTAIICGGMSALVTTILTWKKHKLSAK